VAVLGPAVTTLPLAQYLASPQVAGLTGPERRRPLNRR